MRKFFSKKSSILIAITVLFICGQLAGMYAIKVLFLQYNLQELKPQAANIALQISQGDADEIVHLNSIVKAFDKYGSEILIKNNMNDKKSQSLDDSISTSLVSLLPNILSGGEISSIEQIGDLPEESVVIGVPIIQNSSVMGAVFLLRPGNDYKASLSGFALVFFVTFLVGMILITFFLLQYFKESRKLEQMRRDYVANISHELKSPISSIKALTETLYDGIATDAETKQRYYGIILSESGRLEKLISEMLELSRLQSGKTIFKKQRMNPQQVLQQLFARYTILADDMGISFEVTETATHLPLLFTNGDRMVQVLTILLDNAFKFVNEDGKVTVDATVHKTYITISIKDDGVGIEEEDLVYVFDRFYKQDKARNTQGSGLGLAIAKEILVQMNEKIEVSSEVGKGSIFSITMKRG